MSILVRVNFSRLDAWFLHVLQRAKARFQLLVWFQLPFHHAQSVHMSEFLSIDAEAIIADLARLARPCEVTVPI